MKKLVAVFALGVAVLSSQAFAEAGKKEAKEYPLKTCVVSDDKLGEMGDPFVIKHEGKEVKLCCKSCKKDFDKDPKKYMKKLAEAEKAAKK